MTVLSVFFLTLARILPIMSLAPFLGTQKIPPMTIRMMFSLALVAIFLPANLLGVHKEIGFSSIFIGYFFKELLIGFALGFFSAVPFFVAQMSGSLIDHQRGASSLQVTDPTTQSQTGPIGIIFNLIAITIFYALNGPFIFLDGVATSYQLIPADALVNPAVFNPNDPFWIQVIGAAQTMFRLCVQLSAPALIGILLTDLFLGIANRLAPQVQIVFLGVALKSWVGLALMTAAWALMLNVIGKESVSWMHTLNALIQHVGMGYGKAG
jgi:flagellar biosynthetic protein FliR